MSKVVVQGPSPTQNSTNQQSLLWYSPLGWQRLCQVCIMLATSLYTTMLLPLFLLQVLFAEKLCTPNSVSASASQRTYQHSLSLFHFSKWNAPVVQAKPYESFLSLNVPSHYISNSSASSVDSTPKYIIYFSLSCYQPSPSHHFSLEYCRQPLKQCPTPTLIPYIPFSTQQLG